MSLYSFIEKRRKDLGMTQAELEERADIVHNTLVRIKAGGQIMNSTKQRLALALECSIGDLNAAIAEPVEKEHPGIAAELKAEDVNWKAREKAEQEDAVAKAVQAETEAYAEPEPDKVPGKETMEALFPEEEKDTEEEERKQLIQRFKQADILATAELVERTDKLARRKYRMELTDLLMQVTAGMTLGEDELADLYTAFGWEVVKKLAAEDAEEKKEG